MSLHPVVEKVTARIIARSASARKAYLDLDRPRPRRGRAPSHRVLRQSRPWLCRQRRLQKHHSFGQGNEYPASSPPIMTCSPPISLMGAPPSNQDFPPRSPLRRPGCPGVCPPCGDRVPQGARQYGTPLGLHRNRVAYGTPAFRPVPMGMFLRGALPSLVLLPTET